MEISITVTVLLTLLTSVRVVCGQCVNEDCYNDPLEVLNSIKAYPDNYQQLLNAFYPINRAKPSSVIIAYFTNYTDPLPEECSLGTYPGILICCIDIYAISYIIIIPQTLVLCRLCIYSYIYNNCHQCYCT